MDGMYAGNAGAISGGPWMAGMGEFRSNFRRDMDGSAENHNHAPTTTRTHERSAEGAKSKGRGCGASTSLAAPATLSANGKY